MNDKEFLALAIFALTYLLILAGENSPRKLDRPTAGLLGGVLMVATGVLSRREAAQAIDLGTLGLPFVMLLRPSLATVPNARLVWLTLAASATFARNLTLL